MLAFLISNLENERNWYIYVKRTRRNGNVMEREKISSNTIRYPSLAKRETPARQASSTSRSGTCARARGGDRDLSPHHWPFRPPCSAVLVRSARRSTVNSWRRSALVRNVERGCAELGRLSLLPALIFLFHI